MHSGHSMKRQRGRGRKPGGGGHHHHGGGGGGGQHNSPNRSLETNGPDVKFRGTAAHIHERYLQLARDAASSGDRVLSENYMQHADHYFRLVRSMQPATPPPQQQHDRFNNDRDFEGDDEGGSEVEGAENVEATGEADEQPETEAQQHQQQGDGEGRRRRGRRNRFRPDGERDGEETGASAGQDARPERRERSDEPRRERQPREPREQGEASGPEGFSNGPKPAFLRTSE